MASKKKSPVPPPFDAPLLPPPPPLERVPDVELPTDTPTVRWDPGEEERVFAHIWPPAVEALREKLPEAITRGAVSGRLLQGVPREDLVAAWRAVPPDAWIAVDMPYDRVLSALGPEVVPQLVRLARVETDYRSGDLARAESPEVALYAASQVRGCSWAWTKWLVERRERAAPWLARYALAGDDAQRQEARLGLAYLLEKTDGVLERQALEALGATPEQIAKVLWRDAHIYPDNLPTPVRPSRLWDPLPPVYLRDGTVAPKEVVAILLGVLKKAYPADHPVLAVVHGAVAAEQLDALLEAAWQAWRTTHPDTTAWLMGAWLKKRGEAGARALFEDASAWARIDDFKTRTTAESAIAALAAHAGRDLLGPLYQMATRPPNPYIKSVAARAFEHVKERLGGTVEDDLDRVVPTLGLDGPLTLDFGPRQFHVRLGADLGWEVRDTEGTLRDDLPEPRKKDDPALATAAIARWRAFKKEAKTVLAVQRARLEQAMVTERDYPAEHFRNHVAGNPLLRLLTAGLVWRQGDRTFRIAEDGTFADENDDTYTLGSDVVRLVHPLHLDAALRARWSALAADYALLPVVSQLDRDVYTEAPADGWTASTGAIRGLARLGWVEGGGGIIEDVSRELGGVRVTVSLDPGIERWEVDPAEMRRLLPPAWEGEPTPVVRSEILRELTRIHRVVP